MLFDYETLKMIWWMLVGALLIGFAIAGGMDLGVGNLLLLLGRNDAERRTIINAVGPHWDGNQVWLITAGGAIFAAWPFVYAAAFSGLYMALLLVLFALFFRPVGFDYRSKLQNSKWRKSWDVALCGASFVPSLIFGVAFGNLLEGLPFHLDNLFMVHYEKSFIFALLPLLNPFALLAGLISLSMITMHGALWLQLRTENIVGDRAKRLVLPLALLTMAGFAGAGIWVAFGLDGFRIVTQPVHGALPNPLGKTVTLARGAWLDIYSLCPAALLAPAIGFLGAALAVLFSRMNRPSLGFVASGLSMAGIIGTAGLSMFPFVMPSATHPESSLTMWDATSSHLTLMIMFWAVVIFLPIVLGYTCWCYRRMWGKVTSETLQSHLSY